MASQDACGSGSNPGCQPDCDADPCSRFVAGEACAAPSQANVMQYLKNRSLAVEEARPYAPLRLDLLDLPALQRI